jgi:hypothetical protein
MTSSSLLHSSRCVIDEMNQSSEIIESCSMALDITQNKIQGSNTDIMDFVTLVVILKQTTQTQEESPGKNLKREEVWRNHVIK